MMIRRRKKREAERKERGKEREREREREVAFAHQSKVMRGAAVGGFLFASRHTQTHKHTLLFSC